MTTRTTKLFLKIRKVISLVEWLQVAAKETGSFRTDYILILSKYYKLSYFMNLLFLLS